MSKVTMEFTLPEESNAYLSASRGGVYYSALWEIDQVCRGVIKHDSVKDVRELAQAVRDMMPNLDEIS